MACIFLICMAGGGTYYAPWCYVNQGATRNDVQFCLWLVSSSLCGVVIRSMHVQPMIHQISVPVDAPVQGERHLALSAPTHAHRSGVASHGGGADDDVITNVSSLA